MAMIRQSIDIQVAPSVLYSQLTRFEEFPRFIQDVEALRRLDGNRLHWTVQAANRTVEWESIITEQIPDRRIAWQNSHVPGTTGAFELQPLGTQASRLTLTLEFEPEQVPDAPAAFRADDMSRRLKQDLARLKKLVEQQPAQAAVQNAEPTRPRRSEGLLPQTEELDAAAGSDASDPARAMADSIPDEERSDETDNRQEDKNDENNERERRLKHAFGRTMPPLP